MRDVLGKQWREPDGFHIDVSELSPPEPMVAVLELIERPGLEGPVIFHHNREPVHLYPELIERGWEYETISSAPGEICLKITRRL